MVPPRPGKISPIPPPILSTNPQNDCFWLGNSTNFNLQELRGRFCPRPQLANGDTLGQQARAQQVSQPRVTKPVRREQILLELKLRPHVHIGELAERFGVSHETVRRDFEALSRDGLINRAHGGALSATAGHYPGFDERNQTLMLERDRIGRLAAELVRPGQALMIDAGSTTLQAARHLARLGTRCIVITNGLPIAMALGTNPAIEVILAPGDFDPAEAAVTGTETVAFLERHSVEGCLLGAVGVNENGVSETVRGFAAVKQTMLRSSQEANLLICHDKFGKTGLSRVGMLNEFSTLVSDAPPPQPLANSLKRAGVNVMVAP